MSARRAGPAASVGVAALLVCAGILGGVACQKGPAPSRTSEAPSKASAAASSHAGEPSAPVLCEHRVPSELCTRCDPALAEVYKDLGDWCAAHDRPESQCLECNPGLTFTATVVKDWCREHGVPESMCTKCHPKLVAKFVEANDWCREHRFPRSVCPVCDPARVEAAGEVLPPFPEPGTRVRLASAETARDVGIRTVQVQQQKLARTLEVVGQLTFDQNRHAQLSSRGEALVVEALVDVGDEVKKGQALVRLASAAVGADQAQLAAAEARISAARSTLEREQSLAKKGISAQRDVESAQRELAAAQAEYGAARSALSAAGAGGGSRGSAGATGSGQYTLAAPFPGTVVARDAVAGRTASSGQVLIEVADLSTMWALLEIPEGEAASVRPGQKVTLTLEGVRGAKPLEGRIGRVAPSVDPRSRTVRARVELPNGDRTLRAGLFLRAQISVSDDREALVLPRGAVQSVEGRSVVFLRREPALFEPVAVETGAEEGAWVEIRAGLTAGAEVVTTGAFLLKTELLKDSIGAGCCETGEE